MMATPNFTQCAIDFEGSGDLYANYIYTGPVYGILAHANTSLITVQGCRAVCGTGNEYYAWPEIASTISTWILPILGLLLQAPFESNQFWKTCYAMARWIGSPIASLSYTLWNIKVTSKCAMLVDMATRYEEIPDEDSQYAQIRDSIYILGVMNQFAIKHKMPSIEAERLLRIALFSDGLQLEAVEGEYNSIVARRRELARRLRDGAKRGVVPVFVSQMWFLFSLAITVQSAFGQLGDNATAHDLALGLLLSYFPVLILCFIVDRNPVSPDAVREELNSLLEGVKNTLLNPELRNSYIGETWNMSKESSDFAWTELLGTDVFEGAFFTYFAGQGRVRFHYGVALPILAGIEESFVARYGRNWLREADAARMLLVRGPEKLHGLQSFDFREIWQIFSSFVIVCGSALGAFVLSYNTPTVGLGCRSGGYLVFNMIAVGTFALEGLIWWLVPDGYQSQRDPITRVIMSFDRQFSHEGAGRWKRSFNSLIHKLLLRWKELGTRDRYEVLLLRVLELGNMGWLAYISFAQVVGSYQNCDCMASLWGPHGGYMDFQDFAFYRSNGVAYYWGFGTGLSCTVMAVAFVFIVVEWCTQSHLTTIDYKDAQAGLKRTRHFKRHTYYLRRFPDIVIGVLKTIWHSVDKHPEHGQRIRRSLVWTSHTKPRRDVRDLVYHKLPKSGPRYTWSGDSYDSHSGRPNLLTANTGDTIRNDATPGSPIEQCLSPTSTEMVGGITRREAMIRSGTIRPGPKRSYLPL